MYRRNNVVIFASLLVIVVGLRLLLSAEFEKVDKAVFEHLYRSEGLLYTFMKALSLTASLEAIAAYVAFIVALDVLKTRSLSRETLGLLLSLSIAMAMTTLLKASLQIPRPLHTPLEPEGLLQLLVKAGEYAFPSGHAARATAVAAYYALGGSRIGMRAKILACAWALGVMLSRLVLGAHWFTDVIAGLLVGLLSASLSRVWATRLHGRTPSG